ncbi:MAG: hypothetical protein ACI9Y1_000742 [Lentisphaeria bacterium]|jgi:hypothetical protein
MMRMANWFDDFSMALIGKIDANKALTATTKSAILPAGKLPRRHAARISKINNKNSDEEQWR